MKESACAALCVATTVILREATNKRYAMVTLLPLCFVGTTTISAGVESVRKIYYPMSQVAATRTTGLVDMIVTVALLGCVAFVLAGSVQRWRALLRVPTPAVVA